MSRKVLRSLIAACVGLFILAAGGELPSFRTPSPLVASASRRVSAPLVLSVPLHALPLPPIQPSAVVPGPLDGKLTPRLDALRRPIAVIVDNYAPDARPQTGLGAASLVVETLVEGGITRLMAIYLERDVAMVGPVRSTRVYFDEWASAFHAVLIHVGGNDDAQALLWSLPSVYNLDQGGEQFMLGNSAYYWRTTSHPAPYNMYAGEAKLRQYAARAGQNWAYRGASLLHKRPAPRSDRPCRGSVTASFVDPLAPFIPPDPSYSVRYRFDCVTDTYARIVGSVPQVDVGTGQPIRAANVVVMRTGAATADPFAGITVGSIDIPVVGAGTAWFFRDGTVVQGRWEQKDRFAPLRFVDRRGKPIAFNPGQTWIEVLPQGSTLSWTFP